MIALKIDPRMIDIAIHHIESFRARDLAGTVGAIYRRAYDDPEEDAGAFVNSVFTRHINWPGFRLLLATFEDIPAGFIYGYETAPGQWWHDTIHPAMLEAGIAGWQDGAFELAEVAVDPAVQRRGIGSALIEAFLNDASSYSAVLLSADPDDESAAAALYRRFGFVDLLPDFRYPGFDDRAIIMGRRQNPDE